MYMRSSLENYFNTQQPGEDEGKGGGGGDLLLPGIMNKNNLLHFHGLPTRGVIPKCFNTNYKHHYCENTVNFITFSWSKIKVA